MQTVYARGGSQQREVADGADVAMGIKRECGSAGCGSDNE